MSRIERVKPLRRYKAAKYPSHADPDPTMHPSPIEYPFHRELVRAVAGVGLAAALFGLGCDAGAAQEPPAEKKNPFLLKDSGIPHMTSPYGTGQPSYLGDETARRVIDKIFKDEGFALEPVKYDKDGVAFRTSGFDPKHRIGYVFANWKNLDEDAFVSWTTLRANKTPAPETPETPEVARKWFQQRAYWLQAAPSPIQNEAARITALKDGPEMMEAYLKFRKTCHDEVLSLDEAKKAETEMPKQKDFVAIISQFDPRHELRASGTAQLKIRPLYEKALAEKDAQEVEKLHKQIYELMAEDTLKVLERNVREYIAWARSQGLQ